MYYYVCTSKDLKVLQCIYKYIADYLSVSTSTFLNIELNLITSTSTAKTVLKYKYQSTLPQPCWRTKFPD